MPSLNFPGQVHKWQLSQFLQKGRLRAQNSLLNDLALAARFIIVTAKARISGHFFSVAHAANALLKGLLRLVDMVIGVPSLLAHNLEYKIKEERCRYLVAELVCRVRRNEKFANKGFVLINIVCIEIHSRNMKIVWTHFVRMFDGNCDELQWRNLMLNVNRVSPFPMCF